MKNIWFPILILLNAFCIAHAQSNPDGGHKADSRNMRLVGAHDLQGRSAFQPIIVQQGKRWIAYVGHDPVVSRIPTYEFTADLRVTADPTLALKALVLAARGMFKDADKVRIAARKDALAKASAARYAATDKLATDAAAKSPIAASTSARSLPRSITRWGSISTRWPSRTSPVAPISSWTAGGQCLSWSDAADASGPAR